MMFRPFPSEPSLEFDRKQAKALLARLRAGDAEAMARFVEHHPGFVASGARDRAAMRAGLHDAQLVIAREYGLPSWRALLEKIDGVQIERFKSAIRQGNIEQTHQMLEDSKTLRKRINEPLFDFGQRAIHVAQANPALVDLLLEYGADINLRSDWDKGPFSVLDNCTEDAARHYLKRGAKLTAHAAARLGWIDELRRMLDTDPSIVDEKGGDGQRPLHFAATPQIVDLLLERGATIDAECVDHHSTAAQYALAERPEICRYLVARGARPDIFITARLGDSDLAGRLIAADPKCLEVRVNFPGYAPVPPFNIYCWTLGWNLSPHEVALKFAQQEMYELLCRCSAPKVRLLVACSRADESAARAILAHDPGIIWQLTPADQELLPRSMFNNRVEAVKVMLRIGMDPGAPDATVAPLLHHAAWHGNTEIVSLLLRDHLHQIDLQKRDPDYGGSAIDWACHGSEKCFQKSGDYPGVIQLLVDAGAKLPERIATGSASVKELLRKLGVPE